jgi:hypothetical protein
VLDGGEVGWRMIGSDATFIVAKDHVHDPVQAVLDGPVAACDRPEEMRQTQTHQVSVWLAPPSLTPTDVPNW